MSDYWKSLFLVWLPVGFAVSLIHYILWGEIDLSSAYGGMAIVIIGQSLDAAFGYELPRRRRR